MSDLSIPTSLLRLIWIAWKKIIYAIKNPFSALRHIQNLKWWKLSWDFRSPLGMSKHADEPIYISCLQVFCENKSNQAVKVISGYIISNITGEKLPLTMEGMKPEEADGIPAKCKFFIQALFRDVKSEREGIIASQFIKEWGDFTFIFTADGKAYKYHFGIDEVNEIINRFQNESLPKVTPKITRKVNT